MAVDKYIFRMTDKIGAADAIEDWKFLENCFIDNGYLSIIEDTDDHRPLLIGRTGTGKSALLLYFAQKYPDNVITVEPDELAIEYISNSNILKFLADIGINFDPFFKLLWRHIFIVEILKRQFGDKKTANKNSAINIFDKIKEKLGGGEQKDEGKVLETYFKEWGDIFWEDTDCRVKEITTKVENKITAECEGKFGIKGMGAKGGIKGIEHLDETEKKEIKSRIQNVISENQAKGLKNLIKALNSFLDNNQKKFFILVDRLDENWVEDKFRYRLIMSLIQTAREFRVVTNAKCIVSLRRDLIERVFRLTRDAGFQEEKYTSLYLPLCWNKSSILALLERRVDFMIRHRYTKEKVNYTDLLPKEHEKEDISEFIYKIAPRPRDVISFFNLCIENSADKCLVDQSALNRAINEYSRQRLRALADEWSGDFPFLLDFTVLVKSRPSSFKLSTIEPKIIDELCLRMIDNIERSSCILLSQVKKHMDGSVDKNIFLQEVFYVFYKVGLVGLKTKSDEAAFWVDEIGRGIAKAEVNENTSVVVHPTFKKSLGIKDN